MFNRLVSLFRPKPADPYEQFVVAFIEECGRQGRKPTSYDHQTHSFVFGDSKGSNHTVFIENSFRAWCQGTPKARAEQLSNFVPHPRAAGLYYCSNLEDYQSSLLLMTPGTDFKLPALDGDAVALVPSRNQFFVTGSRNRPALEILLDLAETAGQQHHFCSSAP